MKLSFDNSNSNINFYFSFQCPYSFLAWIHLCNILKDIDTVTLKPLNIGIEAIGNNKYSFREYWGGERWLRLSKEAQSLGISISKPLKFVSEEIPAKSIPIYGAAGAEYYISSAFKAVFSSNIDISITNALRYFLQSECNDSELIIKASENPEYYKRHKEITELWTKNRIRLLPTIEIGKERISGYLTRKQIENLLRSIIDSV